MKESDVMTATRHALMSRGYWPFHPTDGIQCPRCRTTIVPPAKGRPDLFVPHPGGSSSVCEVKDVNHAKGENALYFAEISQEQRDWLNAWDEAAGNTGLGCFYLGWPDPATDDSNHAHERVGHPLEKLAGYRSEMASP